jgi:hypothetical protein
VQPVQQVFNKTQEQLIQFIRQPKARDIAKRILPELVSDWKKTKIVPMLDI